MAGLRVDHHHAGDRTEAAISQATGQALNQEKHTGPIEHGWPDVERHGRAAHDESHRPSSEPERRPGVHTARQGILKWAK
jgi:hypothetical protein